MSESVTVGNLGGSCWGLVYTKVLTQELQVSVGSMKQDRNPRRNH
jgi:hypothetical protein